MKKNTESNEDVTKFLNILKERFESNRRMVKRFSWNDIEARLGKDPRCISVLMHMEKTGGQPALFDYDQKAKEFIFVDMSPESPEGRRNCAYDKSARVARKKFPPQISAEELAEEMGVSVLTEIEYRALQKTGVYDQKTSSWIKTPPDIRERGGALFCDRRYDTVFTYHNGADSYYKGRGFRACLRVKDQ